MFTASLINLGSFIACIELPAWVGLVNSGTLQSEVAADWHELVVPRCIMQPSVATLIDIWSLNVVHIIWNWCQLTQFILRHFVDVCCHCSSMAHISSLVSYFWWSISDAHFTMMPNSRRVQMRHCVDIEVPCHNLFLSSLLSCHGDMVLGFKNFDASAQLLLAAGSITVFTQLRGCIVNF